MKAGRELDALVAEKVFGLPKKYNYPDSSLCVPRTPTLAEVSRGFRDLSGTPCYSTDITAAWLVVEKMHFHYTYLTLQVIAVRVGAKFDGTHFPEMDMIWADTAPLAICKAALKACGVEA